MFVAVVVVVGGGGGVFFWRDGNRFFAWSAKQVDSLSLSLCMSGKQAHTHTSAEIWIRSRSSSLPDRIGKT